MKPKINIFKRLLILFLIASPKITTCAVAVPAVLTANQVLEWVALYFFVLRNAGDHFNATQEQLTNLLSKEIKRGNTNVIIHACSNIDPLISSDFDARILTITPSLNTGGAIFNKLKALINRVGKPVFTSDKGLKADPTVLDELTPPATYPKKLQFDREKELTNSALRSILNDRTILATDFAYAVPLPDISFELQQHYNTIRAYEHETTKLFGNIAINFGYAIRDIIRAWKATKAALIAQDKVDEAINNALEIPLFQAAYIQALSSTVRILAQILSRESIAARFELNTINLEGSVGRIFDQIVPEINDIYFEKDGRLKMGGGTSGSEIRRIVDKINPKIVTYISAISLNEAQFFEYLQSMIDAKALGFNKKLFNTFTKGRFERYTQPKITRIIDLLIAGYIPSNTVAKATILNNQHNQEFIRLIDLCTHDYSGSQSRIYQARLDADAIIAKYFSTQVTCYTADMYNYYIQSPISKAKPPSSSSVIALPKPSSSSGSSSSSTSSKPPVTFPEHNIVNQRSVFDGSDSVSSGSGGNSISITPSPPALPPEDPKKKDKEESKEPVDETGKDKSTSKPDSTTPDKKTDPPAKKAPAKKEIGNIDYPDVPQDIKARVLKEAADLKDKCLNSPKVQIARKIIIDSGMTPDEFNAMLDEICTFLATNEVEVLEELVNHIRASRFKCTLIPRTFTRPITFRLRHFLTVDRKPSGKLGGYHHSFGKRSLLRRRLKLLETADHAHTGYHSARIQSLATGQVKRSTFFSCKDDVIEILRKVEKAIANYDFTKAELKPCGNYRVEIDFEINYKLFVSIEKDTSIVNTFYIIHPEL